jgi:LPXTG-motif cell wall-anchored protein
MNKQKAKAMQLSGALLCVLAMVLCMISCFALPVKAAQAELNIIGKQQDKGVEGVRWQLFKVGERDGAAIKLTGDFAGYPVDLSKLSTTSEAQNAANTLANYARLDKLSALSENISDKNGNAVLTGVGSGVYLVVGSEVIADSKKFTPAPMLKEFTDKELAVGNISIYAKFSAEDVSSDDSDYGVEKVWINADDRTIPENIEVEIYCDGEVAEVVTLSADNNWQYFWTGSSKADWSVKEVNVPDDCTVVYKEAENAFRIENTYSDGHGGIDSQDSEDSEVDTPADSSRGGDTDSDNSEEIATSEASSRTPEMDSSDNGQITGEESSDSGSSSSSSKTPDSKQSTASTTGTGTGTTGGGTTNTPLPQTGSLRWPIPVMAGAGLLLMAAGFRFSRKKEN